MGLSANKIRRKLLSIGLLTGLVFGGFTMASTSVDAAAGVNQQVNFQGRLLTSEGATVPDGYYNIQFKIYQDGDGQSVGNTTGSPSGVLKWTENHLNVNSNGIAVKNGFLSVQLGSVTAFGTSIDWNQDTLWLSMNIGNTNVSCTPFSSCSPDGEMVPMKRLSSNVYALNAGALGGLTSAQFLQLAQGIQTDSSNVASIALNKTGSGDVLSIQASGTDAFTLTNAGDILFGNNANHTVSVTTAAADTAGSSLSLSAGAAGSGSAALSGGDLLLQGGAGGGIDGNGGNVVINGGVKNANGANGAVIIGESNTSTIQIGSTSLASGTQSIQIGTNNTTGVTTNVTIGNGANATAGSTVLQARDTVTFVTNGVTRATFTDSNSLYLGNGITAAAPNNFTISGTSSTTSGVSGGMVTVQAGNATSGNANGGNLVLTGGAGIGTGAAGLVVVNTPTFSTTTNDPNCYAGGALVASSCTIATSSVNGSAAVIVGFSAGGQTAYLPNPTITTAGRVIYITAANGSSDFTLSVNSGGTGNEVALRQNTSATMIWNGTDWTAAGASSSTTLQAAYNNTLTSAGGAEIILNAAGGSADGLTVRNNATTPITGGILEIQTSIGSNLFSVNNNANEFATNGGGEFSGVAASSFASNTWGTTSGGTIDRWTTAGENIATGQASIRMQTTAANHGALNKLSSTLTPGLTYTVSFAAKATATFNTLQVLYSPDGTTTGTTTCASGQTVTTGQWTRVTCNFIAGGAIDSNNAILIRQTDSTSRTFYLDNLSVNVNASATFAADGSVDEALGINWTAFGTLDSLSRETGIIYDTNGSVNVNTPNATDSGVRNNLSTTPSVNTQYLVTFYARSSTAFSDIRVRYTPDGGTTFVPCVDYNTQTVPTGTFGEITCIFKTGGAIATDPDLVIDQPTAADRTFYIDALSVTLNTNNSNNVQIGGANKGGPTTLFTLDRSNGSPIAANNEAYLGSMYYDTETGRIQCYEADGWGACGAQPDNIVNLNPEYPGAVLNGGGIGTMTADFCSNDTSLSVNTSFCATGQAKNFYKWTSPQATMQTYSIIVSYQLPPTFKSFASDDTVQLVARVDNTSNAEVTYQMFKSTGSAVIQCGSGETDVIAGGGDTASVWHTFGINGNEATGCSLNSSSAGNFVIFKINMKARSSANAYVSTLSFTTTGR